MVEALHTRYRPQAFDEVIGQEEVVKALERSTKSGGQQAFLLTSTTPGVGKTTLARIAARAFGCDDASIREIPAAKYTSVDDMRDLLEQLQYRPIGGSENRAIILDECHRLSAQAWDCLLKVMEEPPEGVYWFLCTTREDRVPATIKSRCARFTLRPIPDDDLTDYILDVAADAKIKVLEDIVRIIVGQADGSVRQALVNLEICAGVTKKQEAIKLLKSAAESPAVLELCRFVVDGRGSWAKAVGIINKIEDDPEGVRYQVCNYIGVALANAKTDKAAVHLLTVLEHFATPFNTSEKKAPLFLAVGRVLFGDDG